jgi:hypothetical protein
MAPPFFPRAGKKVDQELTRLKIDAGASGCFLGEVGNWRRLYGEDVLF